MDINSLDRLMHSLRSQVTAVAQDIDYMLSGELEDHELEEVGDKLQKAFELLSQASEELEY